mgnify:CR=1 FL=1
MRDDASDGLVNNDSSHGSPSKVNLVLLNDGGTTGSAYDVSGSICSYGSERPENSQSGVGRKQLI